MAEPLIEEAGSLERFKKRLEKKNTAAARPQPTTLPKRKYQVPADWGGNDDLASTEVAEIKKTNSGFSWKFFIASFLFFIVTLAVAAYVLFFSNNIVSGDNIDMTIEGPTQIRSGDEINLQTTILNRNKVQLNTVSLVLTYPTGTVESLATNRELPMWREKLPDLNSGQSYNLASRAVILGEQNSLRDIKVTLEYHIPDSNAVFTKEKVYQVMIGSAPINLTLDSPTEINSGRDFNLNLKIISNSQNILPGTAIKIDYPSGFSFKEADPAPANGDNFWLLGDLAPGIERNLSIKGSLSGQREEVKSFKISSGLSKNPDLGVIDLEYGSLFKTVNIKNDFVSVAITSQADTIIPGGNCTGQINWTNNLNNQVINGSFELYIGKDLVDQYSIKADRGFYNSIEGFILWDRRNFPDLGSIQPAGSGQASFNFSLLPLAQLSRSLKNATVPLRLVFKGTRLTGQNQTEEISTEASKDLLVSTQASLIARGSYYTGSFKNSGPLPPKVGAKTSYTVTWSLANTFNDLKNVQVKTILPPYIEWLSTISPLDEKVIYNQTSGEVLWDLGSVLAGTGYNLPAREVSFQVSFLPSISQVGGKVDLTGNITLEGQDTFTGRTVSQTLIPVDTLINTDPNFKFGQDKVVN